MAEHVAAESYSDTPLAASAVEVLTAPSQEAPSADNAAATDAAERAAALAPQVEALLLTVDRPVPSQRLAEALGLIMRREAEPVEALVLPVPVEAEAPEAEAKPAKPARKPRKPATPEAKAEAEAAALALVDRAVGLLNDQYQQTSRSFRIEALAGGWRIMTLPAFAGVVAEFHRTRASGKLTRAGVETLAIIAYKQPLTRAQLEAIRGVACGEVLRTLMERRLVTIKGRAEELGRPMLYGTTKQFLDQFGLASIKDLPSMSELKAGS